MKNLGRNVLLTLLGMYILSFIFFFILTVINFPTGDLLSIFYWRWIFLTTITKLFQYFLPVSCSAVLISVSFLFSPAERSGFGAVPFGTLVNSTVLVLLAVLCSYTLIKEISSPVIHKALDEMLYKTEIAENAQKEARSHLKVHEYFKADEMVSLYLQIDPDNEEMSQLKEQIQIRLSDNNSRELKGPLSDSTDHNIIDHSKVTQFIEKAEYYFKMRDYYSAHYFANQALTIDPDRVDIKNLAALSWKKIEELPLNAKTQEEAGYYQRKKTGYKALQDKQYIDAYYIFQTLHEERPIEDPDIQKYFNESKKHVQTVAFFIDDAEETQILPGFSDILFLNMNPDKPAGNQQFIYFKRYVIAHSGYYGSDIEILQKNADGSIDFHLYAQYGKIIDTARGPMLILNGIFRTNSNTQTTPVFYSKSQAANLAHYIVPIYADKDAIPVCSIKENFLNAESIPVLLNFRNVYQTLGYSKFTINMELINRLREPFSFLILTFFAMCLGWITKIPRNRRKAYMFFILPAIPFLFALATELYNSIGSIVYLFFLLQIGFAATIALVVLLSSIVLFMSLFVLAIQTSRN